MPSEEAIRWRDELIVALKEATGQTIKPRVRRKSRPGMAADGIGATIDQDTHFTPAELAKKWHSSPNTIRRLFSEEPGVLKITAERPCRSPRRRRMTQLRIPARVAQRVHARLSA